MAKFQIKPLNNQTVHPWGYFVILHLYIKFPALALILSYVQPSRLNMFDLISTLFVFLQIITHGPHFVFSIASLDSFEQKMAAAQADLRIPSSDYIPIRYRTKNELL